MNNELFELAAFALKTAKSAGAAASRASVNRDRTVEIAYRDRRPETIKDASVLSLDLALFVDGRYSTQSTSDLRRPALEAFITRAVGATRLLAEDQFRSLPDPKYYADRPTLDLQQVDPAYRNLTPADRHRIVREVEDACLTKGGAKAISATAFWSDSRSEFVLVASNGFEGSGESTNCSLGANLTVQDEGDRRPNGGFYVGSVARAELPPPAEVGTRAAERTFELLGAKKIPTATLPIIIENQNVPRVLGGLLAAMTGRNLQQKQSFLAGKKGQKIASDRLTLIDDPLLVGGLGSELFDGEGMTAKRRVVIEAGVLKEFFIPWYYSRKLGVEPTTGGPSNLIIPPGSRSLKEIMHDLGRGVLVNGFIGGNSNSTTGDMSVGITGTFFEGGEIKQPIAEMNIAGNHLALWSKVAEVANDPWRYSSRRTPSVVLTDVVVAGT